MAGKNGVMSIVGGRKPIVLKSETITYTIEHEDGETVALAGYRKGPGCPLPILIEVDEALATVEENEPTAEEAGTPRIDNGPGRDPTPAIPGTLSPRRYLSKLMFAERTLRRMMLQAVIPGLTVEDANVMASDEGPWKDILIELGWRQPDDVIEAAAEDDADPEVPSQSDTPTGDSDLPVSPAPTRAKTRS